MEFILNNKKYSIINQELLINYIMVDSYFKYHSKYTYDVHFSFLNSILSQDKIEFEDIEKGSEILNDLIEKGEINFIPQGLMINENLNNTFNIIYQDLEFNEIGVGEAIPFLITLDSLLKVKPIVTLNQICDELKNFFRKIKKLLLNY